MREKYYSISSGREIKDQPGGIEEEGMLAAIMLGGVVEG